MAAIRIQLPGKKEASIIALRGAHITIGRSPANALQILDRTMSLRHAELIDDGGHYRLHDLGSTNGVFVNGQQVTDYHLREACKLTFGKLECEFLPEDPTDRSIPAETLPSRAEVNAIQKENADLRTQLAQLQMEIKSIRSPEAPATNATGSTVPRDHHHQSVTQDCEALRTALGKCETELAQAQADLTTVKAARDDLQRAFNEQKSTLEGQPKQAALDALTAENAQLKAERGRVRRENSILQSRIEEQAQELTTLLKAHASQNKQTAGGVSLDEHQKLVTEYSALREAQRQSEEEITDLKKSLATLAAEREALGKTLSGLREELETTDSSELEKLRAANRRLTDRIKALAVESMAAARRTQLTVQSQYFSRVSREAHDKLQAELTAMKEAEQRRKVELEQVNRKLADSLTQREQFEHTIKAQESEIESLRRGLASEETTAIHELVEPWKKTESAAQDRPPLSTFPSSADAPLKEALERLGFVVRPVKKSVIAPPKVERSDSAKENGGTQNPSDSKREEADKGQQPYN